jgi:hypothetical protein
MLELGNIMPEEKPQTSTGSCETIAEVGGELSLNGLLWHRRSICLLER